MAKERKSVSSTVDEDVFLKAKAMTGASGAETIRRALSHFVATGGQAGAAAQPSARGAAPPSRALSLTAPAAAAPALKRVADMSDGEKTASLQLLLKTRQALSDAIVALKGQEAVADSDEKPRLRILIGDVQAELTKVNLRIGAFQAGDLTMIPPSAATVGRISDLADKVGRMTTGAQQADLVVAAVNEVVGIWTGTQA